MADHNFWAHNAPAGLPAPFGGTGSFQRVNQHPVLGDTASSTGGDCSQFMSRVENLAIFGSTASIPMPVPRSLYVFLYDDSGSNWGHREALLLQDQPSGFNNDRGAASSEGYMGMGVVEVSDGSYDPFGWGYDNTTVVVFEMFDPIPGSTCSYDFGNTNPATAMAIGLGTYPASGGYVEQLEAASPHVNMAWPRVPWAAYNASNGETRPAMCDVDGNGQQDIVVGLGSGADGYLTIYRDTGTWEWIRVPWAAYNTANGEAYPACGDVDGDGKDEIVAGLGNGGNGYAYVFDDADTGYAKLGVGWVNIGWGAAYNAANGEVHPTIGNLDMDAAEELVLGTGAGGDRYLRVMGNATNAFTPGQWIRAGDTGSIPAANHSVWPAICDGSLVLGASSSTGTGGEGWMNTVDASGVSTGWLRVPWAAYNTAVGATYPVCGNIDGDSEHEIAVGLGTYANNGYVVLFDDQSNANELIGWPRVHWADYNSAVGSTWPALPR